MLQNIGLFIIGVAVALACGVAADSIDTRTEEGDKLGLREDRPQEKRIKKQLKEKRKKIRQQEKELEEKINKVNETLERLEQMEKDMADNMEPVEEEQNYPDPKPAEPLEEGSYFKAIEGILIQVDIVDECDKLEW